LFIKLSLSSGFRPRLSAERRGLFSKPGSLSMEKENLQSDLILLVAATIWGFAFVAQRVGMDYVGPFLFNGVRFALGSLSLLPLLRLRREDREAKKKQPGMALVGGGVAGVVLFIGASLQQVGLVYTTAGKAGFITGLYVVIVPVLGSFLRQRIRLGSWVGAVLAAVGLYLLSITDRFTISFGDLLEVGGAFFWAIDVLIIGWLSPRVSAVRLSIFQFMVCSCLSLATAFLTEDLILDRLLKASTPILYGGFFSVGIAYTLQVVAQKKASPSHAAIILSLETVFAALGGWLFLGETLSPRGLIGCAFMFSAMIISQVPSYSLLPAGRVRRRQPPVSSK
jgi:drug/metabolite transporter (DMT)-like permease